MNPVNFRGKIDEFFVPFWALSDAACYVHFFPILPPGRVALLLLPGSSFRGCQIWFQGYKRLQNLSISANAAKCVYNFTCKSLDTAENEPLKVWGYLTYLNREWNPSRILYSPKPTGREKDAEKQRTWLTIPHHTLLHHSQGVCRVFVWIQHLAIRLPFWGDGTPPIILTELLPVRWILAPWRICLNKDYWNWTCSSSFLQGQLAEKRCLLPFKAKKFERPDIIMPRISGTELNPVMNITSYS